VFPHRVFDLIGRRALHIEQTKQQHRVLIREALMIGCDPPCRLQPLVREETAS